MMNIFQGKKTAVLIADGVEQFELTSILMILKEQGMELVKVSDQEIVRIKDEEVETGVDFHADLLLENADASEFDALIIPGGIDSIDKLRLNNLAINFVRNFIDSDKPVACLSYGQILLLEANAIKNRTLTSDEAIRSDFIKGGANWIDEEVVIDGKLITSKGMNYLSTFSDKLIRLFKVNLIKVDYQIK